MLKYVFPEDLQVRLNLLSTFRIFLYSNSSFWGQVSVEDSSVAVLYDCLVIVLRICSWMFLS